MTNPNKRLKRVLNLTNVIKDSNGDEKKLKAAIAAVDPTQPEQYEPLLAEFTKALGAVREHLEQLDADPRLEPHYLTHGLSFLNTLAEMSPTTKTALRQSELYLVTANDLLADRAKIAELKRLLDLALDEANLAALYQDLLREMVAAKELATEQELEYYGLMINNLKKVLTHQQVSKDELNDLGDIAIKTSNRNLMYDPYRKLGALLAGIYFLTVGAALEAEHHPDMDVAPHESLEGADQAYLAQRTRERGAPTPA